MKKNRLILFLFFYLSACNKSPLDFMIEGGSKHTQTRKIGMVRYITINDVFDITLKPDTAYSISITAGKNIIPYITTKNNNGYLIIENTIGGRWSRKYERIQLTIAMPQLDTLDIQKTSTIITQDTLECTNAFIYSMSDLANIDICVKGNNLYFHTSKTAYGKYIFRGRLESTFMISGGTSLVDASNLKVKKAAYWHNSINEMLVSATEEITELKNFRNGEILVYNNPAKINLFYIKDSSKVFIVEK